MVGSTALGISGIVFDTVATAYAASQFGGVEEMNSLIRPLLIGNLPVFEILSFLQIIAVAWIGYDLRKHEVPFGYFVSLGVAGLGALRSIGGLSNVLLLLSYLIR